MLLIGLLTVLHVFVSIALVVAVLLQSSKGGGLAGTFGGSGAGGNVFGGRGAAPFLAKATTVCAVLFMLTSVSLNLIKSDSSSDSVIQRAIMDGATGGSSAVMDEMPLPAETADTEASTTDSQDAAPEADVK